MTVKPNRPGKVALKVTLAGLPQPDSVLLAAVLQVWPINLGRDQAAAFASPREEVTSLAAAEHGSVARWRRARWARACSEDTRG